MPSPPRLRTPIAATAGPRQARCAAATVAQERIRRALVDTDIKRVASPCRGIGRIRTEHTQPDPQTQSGQINLAVEALVKESFTSRSTIIRAAGLVGKDRHPANYLAGKIGLLNPDNVVNLIHQDDVICAIKTVIERDIWGQTLHLSALEHPTRAQYYTWAAENLGLSAPIFTHGTGVALGKKIDATRSLQLMGLSLKYPSPFDMLRQ